ncbi:MAG: tRNA-2-methylthio-N(6)-dimethylallyladenosine synthase [Candidatus Tectimicrobiota bacterium]|nr:MAG: tRNA-2-methylthio-N(6)-dimethylallyladenosine synthase [Candidatus Tectomicrobia bacterium]
MTPKKLAIVTYGCQMNKYDSERIAGLLQQAGYTLTADVRQAHLVLLNTCSVREKADQKFYSELGRLKRLKTRRPELLIGVCGCIPQRARDEILQRAPYVDLVFGTLNLSRVVELVRQVEETREPVLEITDEVLDDDLGVLPVARDSRVTAFVSVMQGCNKHCSFCVVPATRGPQVSRPLPVVLEEVRRLAEAGYREVTLLGQNVNAYGKDLRPRRVDFADLLAAVNAVDGIARIRFVTSHPLDFTPRLIAAMAELDKVCEYLHLPFQAGSNRILKLMRRGYTAEAYRELIAQIREAVPDIALSTDVIVGFPGETEEDFLETRRMLELVRFDSIFLFKYSPRPGTLAPQLPNPVPEAVKQRRFEGLLNMQKRIALAANLPYEGRTVEVLVEGPSKKDPAKLTGRTRTNKIVNFAGDARLIGELVPVRITRAGLYALEGELASASATLPLVEVAAS